MRIVLSDILFLFLSIFCFDLYTTLLPYLAVHATLDEGERPLPEKREKEEAALYRSNL